jgi:triphosphoribosyl-dephospho-CoA synthase
VQITIDSLEDLFRCINLASNLELSGWPKIGNVHRTNNFENTRYEHFLAGISAIQPDFRVLCSRIYNKIRDRNDNLAFINLGMFFKNATEHMMSWQYGGNVILGHILILAPLVSSAAICLKLKDNSLENFKFNIKKIIEDSTVQDTIDLYEAIRISNPGGLGTVEKYDINDDASIKHLKKDNINLKVIFEISKNYDLISSEYANNFTIILNEGVPYFLEAYKEFKDLNIAIVNTFLMLLSTHIDSLIMRKSGKSSSEYVSNIARKILEKGGISTKKGLKIAFRYDKKLQKKDGKLNPGTTADLLAGVIFCALIFGIRF